MSRKKSFWMDGRRWLKSLSWRFWAVFFTVVVAWWETGDYKTSLKIGIVAGVIKTIAYYIHDWCWDRRKKPEFTEQELDILRCILKRDEYNMPELTPEEQEMARQLRKEEEEEPQFKIVNEFGPTPSNLWPKKPFPLDIFNPDKKDE